MKFQTSSFSRSVGLSIAVAALSAQAHAVDIPFAVAAISYDPGVGGAPGYTDVHSILGSPERFTGDVWLDPIAIPRPPANFTVSAVHFTPGARTAWHSHSHGQTLSLIHI